MISPIGTVMLIGRLSPGECAVLGVSSLAADEGVIVLVAKAEAIRVAGHLMFRTVALVQAEVMPAAAPPLADVIRPKNGVLEHERAQNNCRRCCSVADATTVERLDFSSPPPGYWVTTSQGYVRPGDKNSFGLSAERDVAIGLSAASPHVGVIIAAAWDHYKARHNPPGMIVQWFARSSGGGEWTVSDPKHLIWYACYERRNDGGELVARGAAWNWYEVRLALAQKLDAMQTTSGRTIDMDWPRCLAWSDAEVAAVERWIAAEDGEIEMPEVLRG